MKDISLNYQSTVIIIITLFLFGCSAENKKPKNIEGITPKYGGTMRFLQESPQSLDPLYLDDVYESSIINQMFEGLLALDNNLQIVPGLAETWNISPDKLTYTFYLRKGVKFHNGNEVTADDFIFSINRILDSKITTVSSWNYFLKHFKGFNKVKVGKTSNLEGLQAVDKYTLQIKLDEPLTLLLYMLATEIFFVVPSEEVHKKGEIEFGRNPVGCGPFQFASWEKNKKIVLTANSSYYKGRPYLDTLIFNTKNYTFEELINKFKNKEIDATSISSKRYAEFKDSAYQLITRPEISLLGLGFNINKYPFNIAKFRQALYYAIDNESNIEKNMYSNIPAKSILPQPMAKFIGDAVYKRFDLEKAKILLRESGFKDGKGLDTLELWTTDRAISFKVLNNLINLGLNIKSRYVGWETFIDIIDKKKAGMFAFTVVADSPDPLMFYSSLLSSTGSNNDFYFYDKLIDSLLENMHRDYDFNSLKEICQKIETIASDSVPFVPILYYVNNVALQSYVMDLNVSPYGLAALKLTKVWLNK